jgi:transposase
MISLPSGTHIWIAAGITDLRRGFTGLSAVAQMVLEKEPYSGHVFVFRGRRGDLIKRRADYSRVCLRYSATSLTKR